MNRATALITAALVSVPAAAADAPFERVLRVEIPPILFEVGTVTRVDVVCNLLEGPPDVVPYEKAIEGDVQPSFTLTLAEGELSATGRWACNATAKASVGGSLVWTVQSEGPTAPFVSVDRESARLRISVEGG